MVIVHSYVSLPEGNAYRVVGKSVGKMRDLSNSSHRPRLRGEYRFMKLVRCPAMA